MAIRDFVKGAYHHLLQRWGDADPDAIPTWKSSDELSGWAVGKLAPLISDNSKTTCDKIFYALDFLKKIAKVDKAAVPLLAIAGCNMFHKEISTAVGFEFDCEYFQGKLDTRGNTGRSLANVLTLMDPSGIDGQALVYYLVGYEGCGKPETPYIDASTLGWYGPKPENPITPVSEGKTFNALHISDFHLDIKYQIGSESDCDYYMCCTDQARNQSAWQVGWKEPVLPAQAMGSYHCDAPRSLIDNSLQNVADMHKSLNFELGIFTGDMVGHDPDIYYGKQTVEDTEKMAYDDMKSYLGDMPIFPTFGNHDTYPNSQFAQQKSGFGDEFSWNRELVIDMWKDYKWIDGDQEANAKHTEGSFAATTKRGLRIISLDSNFWYKMNLYNYWNIADPDPSGIFKWFVDELNEAEKKGQKVWVVTHVPTGGDGDGLPWSSEIMRQIIVRFSPHVIAAVFYGHTHADQFTVYYDTPHGSTELINPVSMGWIVQSITPVDNYNPSWRYYEVDTKTFEIMDSKNYYASLSDTFDYDLSKPMKVNATSHYPHIGYGAQVPKNANWEFLYSAREAYDPHKTWPKDAPLNATFWDRVIDNLQSDPQQLEVFYENWYRKSPFTTTCPKGGDCAKEVACLLSGGSYDALYNCRKQPPHKHKVPHFPPSAHQLMSDEFNIEIPDINLLSGLDLDAAFSDFDNLDMDALADSLKDSDDDFDVDAFLAGLPTVQAKNKTDAATSDATDAPDATTDVTSSDVTSSDVTSSDATSSDATSSDDATTTTVTTGTTTVTADTTTVTTDSSTITTSGTTGTLTTSDVSSNMTTVSNSTSTDIATNATTPIGSGAAATGSGASGAAATTSGTVSGTTVVDSASGDASGVSGTASASGPTGTTSSHKTITVTATYCPVCEEGHKWQHPTGTPIPGVATVTVTSATKTVTVTCETDGSSTTLIGTEKTGEPGVAVVTVTKGHDDATKTVTVSCLSSGTSTWYEPEVTESGVAVVTVTPGSSAETTGSKKASGSGKTSGESVTEESHASSEESESETAPESSHADTDASTGTDASTDASTDSTESHSDSSAQPKDAAEAPAAQPKAAKAGESSSDSPKAVPKAAGDAAPAPASPKAAGEASPSGKAPAANAPEQAQTPGAPGNARSAPRPAQANAGSITKPAMVVLVAALLI